jgi:hypothetical protein
LLQVIAAFYLAGELCFSSLLYRQKREMAQTWQLQAQQREEMKRKEKAGMPAVKIDSISLACPCDFPNSFRAKCYIFYRILLGYYP